MESTNLFEIKKLSDISNSDPLQALENGQIIFLPHHGFVLETNEKNVLNDKIIDPKAKNISYHPIQKKLSGIHKELKKTPLNEYTLQMMKRYNEYACDIVKSLFPSYANSFKIGRTSYRPAEIRNRSTSILKDDTRLHVDAFSSTPVQGHRILRVFTNIHPDKNPRVWQVGEPFEKVLSRFHVHFTPYSKVKSYLMHTLGITKSQRTAYDHFMLQLHNQMKYDEHYQETVQKETIDFPSESTWIVFTDQVSHAALSGQFLMEQTFYVPVEAMNDKKTTPLHQLQTVLPQHKML
jgi:3-deoxy-D-manno-oct-2-ulosonic acid (Kdo) hydroxylase